MRIATFNILHGRTVGDGVHPERLADCVRELNPDVLALQEVDLEQQRSGRSDLTAVAAEAMGAVSHRFVAAISGTPGATWMAATGEEQPGTAAYGIALLSRYPAISWRVLRLPPRAMIIDKEPRAAVIAQLDTPLGEMSIANTHLSFVPSRNRRQLRRVMKALNDAPGPHILAGDLNLTPSAAARWTKMRALASGPTYPATEPTRQIDHILTDDPGLRARHSAVPAAALSDHRPLVVDLERG
ncbi:MAG: endonuclease/exonuclease/phosphatase family protein [Mycobacterium sp.]|nr:endonuclease/exonuclease/phosphatase family protein [Mycobacterium sp.]